MPEQKECENKEKAASVFSVAQTRAALGLLVTIVIIISAIVSALVAPSMAEASKDLTYLNAEVENIKRAEKEDRKEMREAISGIQIGIAVLQEQNKQLKEEVLRLQARTRETKE